MGGILLLLQGLERTIRPLQFDALQHGFHALAEFAQVLLAKVSLFGCLFRGQAFTALFLRVP